MKTKYARIGMVLLWVAVAVAIAILAFFYFRFLSDAVYEEATDHLSEVYTQVDRNFEAFIDRNWDNLEDWNESDRLLSDEQIRNLTNDRKELWGFSSFFFMDENGNFLTPTGETGNYELGEDSALLFDQHERIMRNQELSDRSEVTLFAIPVELDTYQGFTYQAVALTYTNADMVAAINTDAFQGESSCLVIVPDGTVILSTQEGASVFTNYLAYLKAGSDLSPEQIESLETAWTERQSGVIQIMLGGQNYFLSYQPCNYQDYILIGVVPESVASQSLLEIQRATIDVLLKCFLLISVVGLIQIILSYRKRAKRNAREIRYRDTMFSRLAANIDDIILMLDGDTWKVDYISPNVERLLGVPADDVSDDIRALYKTLVNVNDVIPTATLQEVPLDRPIFLERLHVDSKTGEKRWYRESIYHQHVGDEEKFIIVMSDRTDERKMNENLQEALDAAKNANEAKSRFLSNMSHDIRTPMNAIMGFTVLLSQNTDNPERVQDYVRKISSSSKHLLSLINDVLDMSKIESGKTSLNTGQFSFQETMDELRTIIVPQAEAKQQNIQFIVKGHPSELLTGDQLRVNQILINLLSNAVKYTPVGGNITFTVKAMPRNSLMREDLRFVIKDNGIGMSPEFLKTIFDPFTREEGQSTKGIQGTGLGMAITKSLVDLMGGVIRIDSVEGKGTTVTVDLSFGMPENFADKTFWTDHNVDRLLVVDDDEDVCKSVMEMMRHTGVNVSYVTSGQAALDAIVKAQSSDKPFSLILLDWKMPGMDGLECARRIRESLPSNLPILVLTAYDWANIKEEALSAGIDGFIAKPFFVTSLQQALVSMHSENKLLEKPQAQQNILQGMHILAAEDNPLNAELLKDRLEWEGATVEIVSNGEEAVERFSTIKPGEFDLMLMDGQMPVMDGYEATKRIRQLDSSVAKTMPIIALTANVFAEDVQAALDAGMDAHLAKPLDMDELKILAERLLRRDSAQGAPQA